MQIVLAHLKLDVPTHRRRLRETDFQLIMVQVEDQLRWGTHLDPLRMERQVRDGQTA